jgi:uncharacterized protein YijF (DUF1287 family)
MRPLRQCLVLASAVVFLISGPALQAKEPRGVHDVGASRSSANEGFGLNLVWAARWQTWIPVIYNPSYRQIPYPDGDVPWYFGVCTDVIVRAYRWLGVDLQAEVKRSGVGSGDTNIDQRRVEVLRKFFARKGRSLPITTDPTDYLPGDIVSYYVPTGWFSKTHIAIVSDRKAADDVPLVIHNRGYGVQEENRLFAEKITGHYRYWPGPAPD